MVSYRGENLKYSSSVQVAQPFVDKLRAFERLVARIAIEHYGRPPERLLHFGARACRTVRANSTRLSACARQRARPERLRMGTQAQPAVHCELQQLASRAHAQRETSGSPQPTRDETSPSAPAGAQQSPWQLPQSIEQLPQCSCMVAGKFAVAVHPAHAKSPQLGHSLRSAPQLVQSSAPCAHTPSPQRQPPQSPGQSTQLSPSPRLQTPSPQTFGHAPQSLSQVTHDSSDAAEQVPSPQLGGRSQYTPE